MKLLCPVLGLALLLNLHLFAEDKAVVDRAIALADHNDFPGAISVLKEYLVKSPDDVKGRFALGRMLDYDGQPEEAIKVWKAGLKLNGGKDDGGLLSLIGDVYERLGNDGLYVTTKHGVFTASPNQDEQKDNVYKAERFTLALETRQAQSKLKPEDARLLAAIAGLQEKLNRFEDALATWQAGAAKFKTDSRFELGAARALLALKQDDKAVAHFHAALLLDPHSAEAYRALAEFYTRTQKPDLAKFNADRATFFEWLPPFASIELNDKTTPIYRALNPEVAEGLDKAGRANLQQKRQDEIARLMKDDSKESTQFLAALCFRHEDCGKAEEDMFEVLGRRGPEASAILHALIKGGQSTCTARGAARALAVRKDPEIINWLTWAVAHDTRWMFHMDAAGSLDVLGDPRAVGPLIKVLDPEHVEVVKEREDDPMNQSLGRLNNRQRVALALGAFKTPESEKALTTGRANKDLKGYCLAALLRMNGDAAVAKELVAAMKQKDYKLNSDLEMRRYLDRFPAGKEVLKEVPEEEKSKGK